MRANLILAAVFLSMAATIGSGYYSFGLFVPELEAAFGWSRTQISASLSFTAAGSLVAPVFGRLMDRYGARPVMVAALTLTGISFLLRPLMSEIWHWYALSFLQFLPFAAATVLPLGRLIGIWFPHKRGRMIGIASTGPNFGGVTLPPLCAALLTLASWKLAYVSLGIIAMGVAVFSLVAVREFPAATGKGKGAPHERAPRLEGWTVREALRARAFYLLTPAVVLGFFTYSCVLPHLLSHLTNEGMSASRAAHLFVTVALLGMLGKVGFGYLAERISARRALILNLLAQAVVTSLLVELPELLLVSVPAYGLLFGGMGVLPTVLVQEVFGLRFFGSIMGLVNMATVISFGLGPLLAGVTYDLTGSYAPAFRLVCAFFVLGSLLLVLMRQPARGAA